MSQIFNFAIEKINLFEMSKDIRLKKGLNHPTSWRGRQGLR